MSSRWSNVPIPEVHLAGLVAGVILHLVWPLSLFTETWIGHAFGWSVVAAGILVVVWAVRTVAGIDVEAPTRLISEGPYAFSRNPMYVSWTAINLGIALITNTMWVIALLPAVVVIARYFVILREEYALEQEFGDEYRQYRTRIRRYFPVGVKAG